MTKVSVNADYDWVSGYLRYGHREGVLELEDEEYKEFKKDPESFLRETGMLYDLKFILDDYRIEDSGDIEVEYKEV